ncbi:Mannitol-1-phosphate 5-dehydrogenase [Geobacillus stearothermophilus]|uniref:Mannitol-1-phosphate 5-dehydrogenase n=1 Tax=Geobacillus stearothermophilus TaxID=1422 RepID=A0A150N455_GEOSE|nr:Mannitol-1-phosphate 5-dehydrogenase [Geobacillus stearothermophilus]
MSTNKSSACSRSGGEYRVIVAGERQEEQWVRGVSALNSQTEREQVIAAIAAADLVTTAVGPHILPAIAPPCCRWAQAAAGRSANSPSCHRVRKHDWRYGDVEAVRICPSF